MNEDQIQRVRRICTDLPETYEKLSHGEPAFFVGKRMYAMFANNHHNDGRVAVWLPAPAGMQSVLIESEPEKFFKPPYVGVRGWVGIELSAINNEELEAYLYQAWHMIAPKWLHARR
ncbi:MAG: MmcQ/YjbR family DNA-binding protein [Caldilineaceae bacterium]|nr:MmcQ/YjbR family DNA-binding protein [Caldilineaceae bacterium]